MVTGDAEVSIHGDIAVFPRISREAHAELHAPQFGNTYGTTAVWEKHPLMDDAITLLREMSDKGVGAKALALIGEPFPESFLILKLHREQLRYLVNNLEKRIEIPPERARLMVMLLQHMDPEVGLLESVQRRFESVQRSGGGSLRQLSYLQGAAAGQFDDLLR